VEFPQPSLSSAKQERNSSIVLQILLCKMFDVSFFIFFPYRVWSRPKWFFVPEASFLGFPTSRGSLPFFVFLTLPELGSARPVFLFFPLDFCVLSPVSSFLRLSV